MTATTHGHTDLDPTILRAAFGQFPSGVAAVCALIDGKPVGMAASTFTSVSLDPPLVSICVQKASRTWVNLRRSPRIGLSVLSDRQDTVCRQLAMHGRDRFEEVPWSGKDGGAVLIEESSLQIECQLADEVDAGDHIIALLRIKALASFPEVEPTVFHRSTFRSLR